MTEELWTLAGIVLSLMIFSYILGDNFIFRLAMHIFVGVGAAYAVVVAVYAVIIPMLQPLVEPESEQASAATILLFVGVALGALLLLAGMFPYLPGAFGKRIAALGMLPMVVLLGVGLALALAGALLGTLGPQVLATVEPLGRVKDSGDGLVEGLFVLLGTVSTLLVFNFTSQRSGVTSSARFIRLTSKVGRGFLLVGFGATFGGVLVASLSLFAHQVQFLLDAVSKLLEG